MEKTTSQKIRLGLFVILGLVIFILAVYYIGNKRQMFGKTEHLTAIFTNVSGLKLGNNVRYSGINVGTIDNITITSDTTVQVEFIVQKEVQKFVRKDSRAGIGSEGLMGDKVLIITPGSNDSPQAAENDFIFFKSARNASTST